MTLTPSGRGSALLAWGVLLVLALHFATGPLLRPLARPYAYSDFSTFYSAAGCFAADRDPYDFDSLCATGSASFEGWIGRYFYPPPFAAVVVRPLAALPFESSRRVWVVLEATAYLLALALLARLLLPWGMPERLAAAAALGLAYAPVTLDLKLGSVSGVLLLLLVLFFDAWRRGRSGRAGLALAAAILLKLSPGLLLAYLGLRGEWRLVRHTLLAAAALVLLCLPWTGVHAYVAYVTRVLPFLASANFSWFTNQSVDAFFWRLFVLNPDTTPWVPSPVLHHLGTATVDGLLLVGLVVLAWRGRRAAAFDRERLTWELALALVASLLVARVTWEYMLVLALPCFALWAAELGRGVVGVRTALVVALAYALAALPLPYAEAPVRAGIGLLFEAPRTYALLLLYGVTWWRLVGAKPA